jgi:putative addiction module component (TIGR02574 family)
MDSEFVDYEQGDCEPPLTPEQAEELDRRLIAHYLTPNDVIPWDTIKDEVSKNYR